MTVSSKEEILVLIMFIICLSSCRVVKREAPDGYFYVHVNRRACESVNSQATCPVSWKLNSNVAKRYEIQTKIVANTIQRYKSLGLNQDCLQALQKVLCSQAIPTCSPVDGTSDYGDALKLCNDMYLSCPQYLVDVFKKEKFCQHVKTGKQPHSPCVFPSTPIRGACPFLKFKVPSDFLEPYRRVSMNLASVYNSMRSLFYDNGQRVFPDDCLSRLEEINCSPTYCSANESYLLVKHDQDDCFKTLKHCYDDPLSKLPEGTQLRSDVKNLRNQLESECKIYPNSSAVLLPEPVPSKTTTTKPEEPVTTKPEEPVTTKQVTLKPSQTRSMEDGTTSAGNIQFAFHSVPFTAITFFITMYF